MKNINKRGFGFQVVLISVIITMLSFFILLSFFLNISSELVSKTDEVVCENFIKAKESKAGEIIEFFYNVNYKCKKDEIKISSSFEKDEVFELIGDRAHSCYNRYGRGEYDFMSNFKTEGQWCFVCSKLKLDEETKPFSFREFIKWSEENKNKEGKIYSKEINFKYVDYDDHQIKNLSKTIDSTVKELEKLKSEINAGEEEIIQFALKLKEMEREAIDTYHRNFDQGENLFIVYRYDRFENKELGDYAQDIVTGAIAGAIAGEIAAAAVVTGVTTLITGPVGAAAGTAKILLAVKKGEKLISLGKKLIRITVVLGKISFFTAGVSGAAVGGYVGANSNYNEIQYVDILNEEQYYRYCGTEPVYN